MLKTIFHQGFLSTANLLLPYVLLAFGMNKWHEEFSTIMVLIILGRGIFYNGYTSCLVEGKSNKKDNFLLKTTYLLVVCFTVYLIGDWSAYSNENILLVFLVASIYYEHKRRSRLYLDELKGLNFIVFITFIFVIIAGWDIRILLLLSVILVFSINLSYDSNSVKLKLRDLWTRKWYVMTSFLSFMIGGGYLLLASEILNSDEFATLRYILILLAPGSFLIQILEVLWFKKNVRYNRKILIVFTLVINSLALIFLGFILSYFYYDQINLIYVIGFTAFVIAINAILRLFLRENQQYGYLFFALCLGSLPYLSLRFISFHEINTVYITMLISQLVMLFIFTIKIFKNKIYVFDFKR